MCLQKYQFQEWNVSSLCRQIWKLCLEKCLMVNQRPKAIDNISANNWHNPPLKNKIFNNPCCYGLCATKTSDVRWQTEHTYTLTHTFTHKHIFSAANNQIYLIFCSVRINKSQKQKTCLPRPRQLVTNNNKNQIPQWNWQANNEMSTFHYNNNSFTSFLYAFVYLHRAGFFSSSKKSITIFALFRAIFHQLILKNYDIYLCHECAERGKAAGVEKYCFVKVLIE